MILFEGVRPLRTVFAALGACGAVWMSSGSAFAGDAGLDEDVGRISVLEENDSLYSDSDKHYTQGFRLSYLTAPIGAQSGWSDPFDFAGGIAPIFSERAGEEHTRRYAFLLGQSIFTPTNKTVAVPDPNDRPYGAWLYTGASLLQETDRNMLENLEVDVGVVGPQALGEQTQNDYHQLIGINQAKGWGRQIRDEPGITLNYERLWRVSLLGDGKNGIDLVPQVGATVGNVFTFGDAGALLRFGKNLGADYGPVRIRPALSGTDYFNRDNLDGSLGIYGFVGVQGRIVGRNIFLDGNSFSPSPSIEKRIFVGDVQAGVSVFWNDSLRLEFSTARRSREYAGQPSPDIIGTALIAFSL